MLSEVITETAMCVSERYRCLETSLVRDIMGKRVVDTWWEVLGAAKIFVIVIFVKTVYLLG